MRSTLDALEGAFKEIAAGDAVGMGRIDLYVPSGETTAPFYRWAVMTGGSRKDGYVCARMLSDMVSWPREHGRIRENKYARAPGTFCGLLFLFSVNDATPVAMINDGVLQHMRVGGGAGLGAKYLSRRDARIVGMIGSGGMARTYLDALCCVRADRNGEGVQSEPRKPAALRARDAERATGSKSIEAASAKEAVAGTRYRRDLHLVKRAGVLQFVARARTACDQSDLGRYRADTRAKLSMLPSAPAKRRPGSDRIPTRPSTRVRDS